MPRDRSTPQLKTLPGFCVSENWDKNNKRDKALSLGTWAALTDPCAQLEALSLVLQSLYGQVSFHCSALALSSSPVSYRARLSCNFLMCVCVTHVTPEHIQSRSYGTPVTTTWDGSVQEWTQSYSLHTSCLSHYTGEWRIHLPQPAHELKWHPGLNP